MALRVLETHEMRSSTTIVMYCARLRDALRLEPELCFMSTDSCATHAVWRVVGAKCSMLRTLDNNRTARFSALTGFFLSALEGWLVVFLAVCLVRAMLQPGYWRSKPKSYKYNRRYSTEDECVSRSRLMRVRTRRKQFPGTRLVLARSRRYEHR